MTRASAAEVDYAGWRALALENEHARLVAIPEIGGKIVSLHGKAAGTELLWQDPTRPYRAPVYGDEFGNYDASGFDECFPSIGECLYPAFPWSTSTAPDHGELWCVPWRAELASAATIYLHTYGVRFPYHFEKWIALAEDSAHYTLTYRLTNLSPFELPYLWSAHPLFAAEEGMQILLPGSSTLRLNHAIGNRVRGDTLQEYTWPWVAGPAGEPVDYSLVGASSLNANDKVFADTPADGWCALYRPESGECVAFAMSPQEVPFVGVCVNHGGWPFSGARGYWVALEPCTGWPDRLDDAIRRGAHRVLPPGASREWSLSLLLGRADSAADAGHTIVRAIRSG